MRTDSNIWKECIICKGLCCKWEMVFLSIEEINRIKKKTKRDDFYFKKGNFYRLKQNKNGYCLFYDTKKHRCPIYNDRPFDCKLFPFDIIKKDKKYFWIVWTFCPAVKKQIIDPKSFSQFLEFLEFFEKTLIKDIKIYIDDYSKYSDEIMNSKHSFKILRELVLS